MTFCHRWTAPVQMRPEDLNPATDPRQFVMPDTDLFSYLYNYISMSTRLRQYTSMGRALMPAVHLISHSMPPRLTYDCE